jgi:dihydrofolate reductase
VQIELIAAVASNGTIGIDGRLPWHIKEDMYHFYNYTMGLPVVMGRKTFESIGKALHGRVNIVLTSQQGYTAAGCLVAHDVGQVLAMVQNAPKTVVIGGAKVYEAFLPYANRLILTHVLADVEGDTHFPDVDGAEWAFVDGHYYEAEPSFGDSFAIAYYDRVGQAAPIPTPATSTIHELRANLPRVNQLAIEGLEIAKRERRGSGVNWGTVLVIDTYVCINLEGEGWYEVLVCEASPDAGELSNFISDYIARHGFDGVEVRTEW